MKVKNSKSDVLSSDLVSSWPYYSNTSSVPQEYTDQVKAGSGMRLVLPIFAVGGGAKIMAWDGTSWSTLAEQNVIQPGLTAARPSSPVMGQMFFDSGLSPSKAIIWNGSAWVNMDGTSL